MAAKNNIKSRIPPVSRERLSHEPVSREERDLQDLMGLHFQASRRVEEVQEQIREMRAAGRLTEARALQMHADGIRQGIRALEAEVRLATQAVRQH